ncbi:MAG: redoxin family protein [Clostridia bacterium]|nr:redoxin family protein [Clostridia bacterium]
MDKSHASTQSLRPMTRRLVQLYSALLHNAHIKGFIDGQIYQGKAKYACVPGLNCYSCPGATGACPLGAIQNALASTGHRAGWYVLGIILLFGVSLGRTICGWLCPLGLIQELLHKIPAPKIRKSAVTRALTWLKYGILAVFVIAVPLWYGLQYDLPLPAFCKYLCPAGTLEGAVGLLSNPVNASFYSMLGVLFTRKFVIMATIGLACVFCYRSFCRFLCPLGAIYGLFNRFNIIGVKVDESKCTRCGACVGVCPMDVRRVGDHECIHCGKCMAACHPGAISITAGKITLKSPQPEAQVKEQRRGRVLWTAALAVLCFALLWFNVLDPAVRMEENLVPESTIQYDRSDAPIGKEVGDQLEDFSLTCYDGTVFHLADQRGKIVFINLWATYCTPCKQELPYFSDLYRQHEGDIAMLAVHPSLVTDDPEEYLADRGYSMPFATDAEDQVARIVGSSGVLPQTIVLNRRGEVIYNQVGSVTEEMLAALYAQVDE